MSEQEVELVEEQEKVVLEEREAFALLRQGAGVWNAWVERNPVAEVFIKITGNFRSGHGFIRKEISSGNTICFNNLKLPKGKLRITSNCLDLGLDFTGSDLSQINLDLSDFQTNRSVILAGCHLADGGHHFENMQIKGLFDCSDVDFGNGLINFSKFNI